MEHRTPFSQWPIFTPREEHSYSSDHAFKIVPWADLEEARRAAPHVSKKYVDAGMWYGVTITPRDRFSFGEAGAIIRVAVPDTLKAGIGIDPVCMWSAMAARAWHAENVISGASSYRDLRAISNFIREGIQSSSVGLGHGFFSSNETARAIVRAVADSDHASR